MRDRKSRRISTSWGMFIAVSIALRTYASTDWVANSAWPRFDRMLSPARPMLFGPDTDITGTPIHRASMVVVKGAIGWRGAYDSVAGEIIEVATPGICPIDVTSLPRRTVPMSL